MSVKYQAQLHTELHSIGFAQLPGTITDTQHAALWRESTRQFNKARLANGGESLQYRSRLASLGPVGKHFLLGRPMGSLLESVFGQPYQLSSQSSCYTYYREGDFISAHKDDADSCKVTVLIYLVAQSQHPEKHTSGLYLDIYQDDNGLPEKRLWRIQTKAGVLVLGRGSEVWHARQALLPEEQVDLLSACFTPAINF